MEKAEQKAKKAGPISEAQWFYEEGLRLQQRGEGAAAKAAWQNVVRSFHDVPAEEPWVRLAEHQLEKPDERILSAEKRWEPVRAALRKARELRDQGKRADAETIWRALEQLYREDASAAAILEELRHDRGP